MIDNDLNPLDPDEESVPGDEESEPDEPISLDEIEAAHRVWFKTPDDEAAAVQAASFVLDNLPFLFAELRAARKRLDLWQDHELQYAVMYPNSDTDAPVVRWIADDLDKAHAEASLYEGSAWVRDMWLSPWRELTPDVDNEPPF